MPLQRLGDGAPIAPLPQNNNEGLLTLQEIAARLDVGYGRLRGFAGAEGMGELLGAVDVRGVKGVRYEPRALAVFRRLVEAQDARQVIPATARAWLVANAETPQPGNAPGEDPNALLPQPGNTRINNDPAALLTALLDRLGASPPDDRLLSSADAAELLACKPRAVGRYVRPVRPGVYRRSDVLTYIAGLRQM